MALAWTVGRGSWGWIQPRFTAFYIQRLANARTMSNLHLLFFLLVCAFKGLSVWTTSGNVPFSIFFRQNTGHSALRGSPAAPVSAAGGLTRPVLAQRGRGGSTTLCPMYHLPQCPGLQSSIPSRTPKHPQAHTACQEGHSQAHRQTFLLWVENIFLGNGAPPPPPDRPPASNHSAKKNEIYNRENLVRPFWYINFGSQTHLPQHPLLIQACPMPLTPVLRCSTDTPRGREGRREAITAHLRPAPGQCQREWGRDGPARDRARHRKRAPTGRWL